MHGNDATREKQSLNASASASASALRRPGSRCVRRAFCHSVGQAACVHASLVVSPGSFSTLETQTRVGKSKSYVCVTQAWVTLEASLAVSLCGSGWVRRA